MKRPKKKKRRKLKPFIGKCIACGEHGPHYVPPSMGEPGFFTCQSLAKMEELTKNAYAIYCAYSTRPQQPWDELPKTIREAWVKVTIDRLRRNNGAPT